MTKQHFSLEEMYEEIKRLNGEKEEKKRRTADDLLEVNNESLELDDTLEFISADEDDEAQNLEQKLEVEREISDNPDEESLVFDKELEIDHEDLGDETVEITREIKGDLPDESPEQEFEEEPVATGRRRKSKTNVSEKEQKSRSRKQTEATMSADEFEEEEAPKSKVAENIKYTRNFIDMTRRNRMNLSERLMRYSRRWKLVFFAINMEAVIFVLLSLMGTIENFRIGDFSIPFSLLSGIFTIYVILLQYYINVLNYNERALRAHYHQLELRDLGLQLNMLLIKKDTDGIDMTEKDLINKNEEIIEKYQLALKNNENHRQIDNKVRVRSERQRTYLDGSSKKRASLFPPLDFTLDNMLIVANAILTLIMLIIMVSVLLGVTLF